MDLYDFFNTFIEAVSHDAELSEWAQARFGRPLRVLADLEGAALPQRDDMPYAIFHTPEVSKHRERMPASYIIGLDLALDKDSYKTRAEGNLAEPSGLQLIMNLVEKVADAIEGALPANYTYGYHLMADTMGSLPEVHGYMDVEFQDRGSGLIGTDPMA